MDHFDFSDDDVFEEELLSVLSEVESQQHKTPAHQTTGIIGIDVEDAFDDDDSLFDALAHTVLQLESQSGSARSPIILELDDSLDDDESASQALARCNQQPTTPCPPERPMLKSDKHDLASDENQPTKKTRNEIPEPSDFAEENRSRRLALPVKPWARLPLIGEADFGDPDFEDPDVKTALASVEKNVLSPRAGQGHNPPTEIIQITPAQLEAIKQNAFTAGQQNHHRLWKRRYTFDFFSKVPAEIRLMIYEYALQDSNPATAEGRVQALPRRHQYYDPSAHSKEFSAWPHADQKPWINLALLQTCKKAYYESRDAVLYKNRQFDGRVALNSHFKEIMKEAPRLSFWQHIQHIHLILRPVNHMSQWKRHVTQGVQNLTALLRAGKKLKSFNLSWEITQHSASIGEFEDMRVSGSIVVTQHFDDATMKDGQDKEEERLERIRVLMRRMQGLRPNAPTDYDVVRSQTEGREGPYLKRSEMQIRVSTR